MSAPLLPTMGDVGTLSALPKVESSRIYSVRTLIRFATSASVNVYVTPVAPGMGTPSRSH